MDELPVSVIALAEAVAAPSREMAAGLLLRPAPVPGESPVALDALCQKLQTALADAVPAIQECLAALEECDVDDTDELVDELVAPAFALIDAARSVWTVALPPEAEGARPLLATLVEAPVTELLAWMGCVMHAALDPWAVFDDPQAPGLEFSLDIDDLSVRESLRLWRLANPGILPGGYFL